MSTSTRATRLGLRALARAASWPLLDTLGMRAGSERTLQRATRSGFRAAAASSRGFQAVSRLTSPVRQRPSGASGLFDLEPDEEQQMLREAVRAFAAEIIRPAAGAADAACATPGALLDQAAGLGLATLGIPEELGGATGERSAITAVLATEALGHGDMGIATAILAPGAVASAIGLWGDAEQQSAYLPAFTGESPPRAALALLEPRPLFDPLELRCSARPDGESIVLDGVKSLVPQAQSAELFLIAAELAGTGPVLVLVEAGWKGILSQSEPAMGLRASATASLLLDGVRAPRSAVLADGDPQVFGECVARARLAWCALAVGCARAVLEYVTAYVNERVAFGEPISHRQAVAFAVADIAIELEGMRLATWRAVSRADRGEPFAREVALARSLCARHGMRIASDGVQLLGGHGYVKEHPVERWYRDMRACALMEGVLLG